MKSAKSYLSATILSAIIVSLSGCSSALYSSVGVSDDLYATHNRKEIAQAETRKADIERAEAEARSAKLRAAIAQAEADAAQVEFDESTGNPYVDILADDYESAYERRLRGFQSPTYRMPSSYYNFRYGNQASYATAYDPSFYNVMVMGDEVWVEPKYITSMFGTWGTSSVNLNLNFGMGGYWGSPWGWNNPYYGGFYGNYYGWGYPSYGWGNSWWGNSWWGGGHYPHHNYPHWGPPRYPSNVTYRPSYGNNNNKGNSTSYRRPSGYTNSNVGTSGSSGIRNSNSTGSYRRNSTTTTTTNRDNNTNSYNRNDNNTNRRESYTPPSSSGSSRSSGSYGGSSGGGSYGGSSGGGGRNR